MAYIYIYIYIRRRPRRRSIFGPYASVSLSVRSVLSYVSYIFPLFFLYFLAPAWARRFRLWRRPGVDPNLHLSDRLPVSSILASSLLASFVFLIGCKEINRKNKTQALRNSYAGVGLGVDQVRFHIYIYIYIYIRRTSQRRP